MNTARGNYNSMKIFDYRGFPNPSRVRIALAEKGMTNAVQFIAVDVPGGEHRRPEFIAKNPMAAVPVLELSDGTTIAECTAITEYLDHLEGEPTLTGKGALERARIHMMQRRVEAGILEPAVTYFHHATPGLGPDLEVYQNREWGERNRDRAIAGIHYLDGVLKESRYVGGPSFSVADITAFVGLSFAEMVGISIPPDCLHIGAWRARVAARPSIASA
jgi:glutathione S-transferase